MKVVIAPDSFKGTLPAINVAKIIAQEIEIKCPNTNIKILPLADGGEGTMDCIRLAIGGKYVRGWVSGPFLGEKLMGNVLVVNDTAIVESAKAIGLPLAGKRKNPLMTTTFGVGEMIKLALNEGVKNIVLALGGSSTNDGGIGMAVALGAKAYMADGSEFVPTCGKLNRLKKLDLSGIDKRLNGVNITAMCDVTNPLCGENGASYVYGPQKGAVPAVLPVMDKALANLAEVYENCGGKKGLQNLPGAGAAGGLGFGAMAFLNATLKSGIETIFGITHFEEAIDDADLVITGEGRFDSQSLMGKVVGGVTEKCVKMHKKLVVVTGVSEIGKIPEGIELVLESNPNRIAMKEVCTKAESMLREALRKSKKFDYLIGNW